MEHHAFISSESTEAVIDVPSLLTPLSKGSPCGDDLIYSETYDAIKEARRQEDANLPRGVWDRELKRADWSKVIQLCEEALATSSKDLQIAAWLTEALLCLHGPRGLHEGLILMLEMTRTFWDEVKPLPEGDMDKRTAPYRWINTKLAERVKFIAITEPDTNQGRAYTYADWAEAEYIEHLGVRDKKIIAQAEKEGKASREVINQVAAASSDSFYSSLTNEIAACLEVIMGLEDLLDTLCEKDSPGFGALREILQSVLNRTLTWNRMNSSTAATENTTKDNAVMKQDDDSEPIIRSRQEAYAMLNKAADFLLATEPHSPTPYLVKRAVSWGQMPLADLLGELVGEAHSVNDILSLLGIPGSDSH